MSTSEASSPKKPPAKEEDPAFNFTPEQAERLVKSFEAIAKALGKWQHEQFYSS